MTTPYLKDTALKRIALLTPLLLVSLSTHTNAPEINMDAEMPRFHNGCEFPDILLCSRIAALKAEQAQVEALTQDARRKKIALYNLAVGEGFKIIAGRTPSIEEIETYYSQGYVMLIDNGNYIFCDPAAVPHKALIVEMCRIALQKTTKSN